MLCALKLFEKSNRPRILKRTLQQLREAVAISKWSQGAKIRAEAAATSSLQRRVLRKLKAVGATALAARVLTSRADEFAKGKLVEAGWFALRQHPAEKKV